MSYSNPNDTQFYNHFWRGTAPTYPGTIHIGLSTTAPDKDGGNITEVTGNNYGRVAVPLNTANWSAGSNGSGSNSNVIQFPAPSGPWGTPTYWIGMSATSGGTMECFGQITNPQAFDVGSDPRFEPGDLVIDHN